KWRLGGGGGVIEGGHEVIVACAEPGSTGDAYWNGVTDDVHGGVPVRRVALNWTKASDPNRVLYDSDPAATWFDRLVVETDPDIVHVTSAATLGVGVLQVAHRRGVPLILTLMDFWFLCPGTVSTRGDGELCDGRTTPWECQRCLLTSSNLFQRLQPWMPESCEQVIWSSVCKVPPLARLRGARGMALDMADRKSE